MLRYLFPNTKGSITLESLQYKYPQFINGPLPLSYQNLHSQNKLEAHYTRALLARDAYFVQIKRKFGLNFLSSLFVPRTDAFKARITYIKTIRDLDVYIDKMNKNNNKEDGRSLTVPTTTSSWFFFLHPLSVAITETIESIRENLKAENGEKGKMLDESVPFLRDVMSFQVGDKEEPKAYPLSTALPRLLHTILNPFKLASDMLRFSNFFVNYLFANTESRLLKAVNYAVFGPLRLVFSLLETALDLVVFYPIKLLVTPIAFLGESLYQTFKNWNYSFEEDDLSTISQVEGFVSDTKIETDDDLQYLQKLADGWSQEGQPFFQFHPLTRQKKDETPSCFEKNNTYGPTNKV